MNAVTANTLNGRPSKTMGVFLFVLLLAIAVATAAPLLNQAKTPPIVIRGGSAHGDFAHGDEGTQARNCLEQHGTSSIYLEPDGRTFHFLCQSDSGDWFDVVAVKEGDEYVEKTALEPQGGILEDVVKWLTKNVSAFGKGATIYKMIAIGTTVIFK